MSQGQPAQDGETYVTLKQAAELLGITRQHMRRVAIANRLQAFTTPMDRRTRLYRRSEVEALRRPQPLEEGKALAA